MNKNKVITIVIAVAVGVILADKIRTLPVANKLPTI